MQWTNSNGIITSDTLIDVAVTRPTSKVILLTFAPLRTSHGGVYRCVASVEIAEAGVSLTNSLTSNVTVQSKL